MDWLTDCILSCIRLFVSLSIDVCIGLFVSLFVSLSIDVCIGLFVSLGIDVCIVGHSSLRTPKSV